MCRLLAISSFLREIGSDWNLLLSFGESNDMWSDVDWKGLVQSFEVVCNLSVIGLLVVTVMELSAAEFTASLH
jgi:hypothetical protein